MRIQKRQLLSLDIASTPYSPPQFSTTQATADNPNPLVPWMPLVVTPGLKILLGVKSFSPGPLSATDISHHWWTRRTDIKANGLSTSISETLRINCIKTRCKNIRWIWTGGVTTAPNSILVSAPATNERLGRMLFRKERNCYWSITSETSDEWLLTRSRISTADDFTYIRMLLKAQSRSPELEDRLSISSQAERMAIRLLLMSWAIPRIRICCCSSRILPEYSSWLRWGSSKMDKSDGDKSWGFGSNSSDFIGFWFFF